jgi:hypothetical protein
MIIDEEREEKMNKMSNPQPVRISRIPRLALASAANRRVAEEVCTNIVEVRGVRNGKLLLAADPAWAAPISRRERLSALWTGLAGRLLVLLTLGCLGLLIWIMVAALWISAAHAAPAAPVGNTLEQRDAESADSSVRDGFYVVQWGDTLSQIAVELGTSVDYLARYNGIADPDVIYSGQILYFEPYESQGVSVSAGHEPEEAMVEGEAEEGNKARPDEPDEAARLRFLQDRNENGNIPSNALIKAAEQAEKLRIERMPGTPPSDLSPAANIDRSLWTWRGPGNVGGRIRSIAIHPTNPQVMWVGSVGGGIWKTTDGGASWQPLDDFMANLAVSTLAIDPTNPNVLYAGTGEGFYNPDSLRGAGIFKTTDGGATWTQLSSTANSDFEYVNRLSISPSNSQVLLAATGTGMFRSTDGGTNWTKVLTPPPAAG